MVKDYTMFGNNQVQHLSQIGDKLKVQSIFYTLQGEGPETGRPAVFVRLAGCNLTCTMCDTEFDTGLQNPPLTSAEVLTRVLAEWPEGGADARCDPLVVLTGGEPLLQDVSPLLVMLCAHGFDVQIETAGTVATPDPRALEHALENFSVSVVCSPKTPKIHSLIERYCWDYKYVVDRRDSCPTDGLPTLLYSVAGRDSQQRLYRPPGPEKAFEIWGVTQFPTIWVSPCDTHDIYDRGDNVRHAACLVLKHGYRLSLQTHKIVGVA